MEKMTKRDYFTRILSYAHDEDKAFIQHELDLLDRKNSKPAKPTKKQAENITMIGAIYDKMEAGNGYTASDILEMVPELRNIQKASALITQMRKNLMVTREVTKGKAYFYKV